MWSSGDRVEVKKKKKLYELLVRYLKKSQKFFERPKQNKRVREE